MYGTTEPLLLLLCEWLLLELAWEGIYIDVDVYITVFLLLVTPLNGSISFFLLLLGVLVWLLIL